MLVADARNAVKKRLDIATAVTTFDTDIDQFVTESVKRLYPFAQYEFDPQVATGFSVAGGRVRVDLSTLAGPVESVRFVESSDDGTYYSPVDHSQHGKYLTIDDVSSSTTRLQIYGLGKFTLANLYDYLEQAVVYYACAEFFKFLIGNKRKYNVYMQNGRANVDNMQDLADYYEQQANQYLSDRATLYGQS